MLRALSSLDSDERDLLSSCDADVGDCRWMTNMKCENLQRIELTFHDRYQFDTRDF